MDTSGQKGQASSHMSSSLLEHTEASAHGLGSGFSDGRPARRSRRPDQLLFAGHSARREYFFGGVLVSQLVVDGPKIGLLETAFRNRFLPSVIENIGGKNRCFRPDAHMPELRVGDCALAAATLLDLGVTGADIEEYEQQGVVLRAAMGPLWSEDARPTLLGSKSECGSG